MGYTDKELQLATQVAYMNINDKKIKEYFDQYGEYPTLHYLLAESDDKEKIYSKFMEKFPEDATGNVAIRQSAAKELLDSIINGSAECSKWRIAAVEDQNKINGMYACLIETGSDEAIVGFRGSESIDTQHFTKDWIEADFGLFNNKLTEQQKSAQKFMEYISENKAYARYKSLAVTGHSLGGNLATYAVLSSGQELYNRIKKSVSFDGPGFSTEFLSGKYKKNIAERGADIIHYQWSFVGEILRGKGYCEWLKDKCS